MRGSHHHHHHGSIEGRKKDGYPVDHANCKYECWYDDKYCDDLCKKRKADSGYCYKLNISCYCLGLPDNAAIKDYGRCRP
nr:recombinant long-chain sodium channel specific toxin 8 [synthetic construct]